MQKIWIIAKEVFKKTVKSFGFMAVVLSPIIMIALILGVNWFLTREAASEDITIAVVGEESIRESFLDQPLPFEVSNTIYTKANAQESITAGEIEGYLLLELTDNNVAGEMVHEGDLSQFEPLFSDYLSSLQTTIRAQEHSISPAEITELNESVEVEESIVSITDNQLTFEESEDNFIQQASAYVISIAIFMFIMTYSSIIAEEIASEKGTRIMEIILSSITASEHFFGKLLGVIMIMLTQVLFYVVLGFGAFQYLKDHDFIQNMLVGIDLRNILQELLGYTLIFFVVGVLMYVVLAAFFGSLITKIEDVSKSTQPLIFLSIFGFYLGIFSFTTPDNILAVIGSYFPLFSPFVMPFRIAAGTVDTMGIWLSIIGIVVTAGLITWASLAFYKSNVLVYSNTNFVGTLKRSWSVMQSNRNSKK